MIVQALFPEPAPVDHAAWERFVARLAAVLPGLPVAPVACMRWWVVLEVGGRTRWVVARTPEDAADEMVRRVRP